MAPWSPAPMVPTPIHDVLLTDLTAFTDYLNFNSPVKL